MADNIELPLGSGGDVTAADDISGVKYQRIKLIHGADGINDGDVSTSNGLPIQSDVLTEIQNLVDSINTLTAFLYANTARMDVANRLAVNGSEVTQPVSGSVTVSGTVTSNIGTGTLALLTNITNVSGQPVQYLGQDVPVHIYDKILIS